MSKITIVEGDIIEIIGGSDLSFAKGEIINIGSKVIQVGKESGVSYGEAEKYSPIPPSGIISIQWLDEAKVKIGTKEINETQFSDILYGQKVRVEITTENLNGKKAKVTITAKPDSSFKKVFEVNIAGDKATIKNAFLIPLSEYDDTIEKYEYSSGTNRYRTIVPDGGKRIKEFIAEISIDTEGIVYTFSADNDILKPYTYRRNYEELIGLFKVGATESNPEKDKLYNYENEYIENNVEIKKIVNEFISFLNQEDLVVQGDVKKGIKERVGNDAKKLWDEAVKKVEGGLLDDRPLYWARNKMQTHLKRHPLFKTEVNFEQSKVLKGTRLYEIINLFEEKSRNYKGVDFSKAPFGTKKILLTGFDPFVLNEVKYKNILRAKTSTQNPSGISALYFHNKKIGNAYIQTAIVPVRYEDFDNSIIENLVENTIATFDIMFTTSRNDSNFDLERFGSKFRGGFIDNMGIGDSQFYIGNDEWDKNRFKQIPPSNGNEFYETTLPIDKILVGDLDVKKNTVFFDQSFIDDKGNEAKHPAKGGSPNNTQKDFPFSNIKGKSTINSGSGGDYLSNEIMYRATGKRDLMKLHDLKAVGHVHLADNLSNKEIVDTITKIIKNATS